MPTTTINLTGQALTKTDDTNVTLTLGGTPLTALLKATSLTLGWTGQLSVARGGTGLSAIGTANQLIRVNAGGTALEYFTPSFGSGTVTTVSVVSANGFAGTVANATTTPAITLTTSITGLLKGNGTAISAAAASDVTGQLLTGYVSGAGVLAATDTILQGFNKLNGNIAALVTGVSSVTGSGNIASSGGATPNITFTGVLPVANGGTNASSAGITAFNNITGYTAAGATGTTSTNLVFSTSPTLVTPILGAATGTSLDVTGSLTSGVASTTSGTLVLRNAASAFTQTIRGTNPAASITYDLPTTAPTAGQVLQSTAPSAGVATLSWATASSGAAISGLTLATASNTIDNTNYAQEWQWSTLAGGNGLKLSSTSTAAASNTQTLLNIALSGANGTATQTTYGLQVSNTHTGTTSTNIAGYFTASGGTTNWGIYSNGSVTIGAPNTTDTTAANGLQVEGGLSILESAGRRRFQITNTGSGIKLFTINDDIIIDATYQVFQVKIASVEKFKVSATTLTIGDAVNFSIGTTTGTKFGTSTSQKISFYNSTPIVQPTTAVGSATLASPGAGTSIKSDDTFDGYTLQQIVKALRNLGLLA